MDETNQHTQTDSHLESLIRSVENQRAFFEHHPEAIVAGEVSGRIHFVNDAACRLFGYDRATLLTMSVDDLLANDDATRQERWQELLEQEYIINPAAKYITRSGEICAAVILTRLIREQGDENISFLALVHDVTEQHRALEMFKQRTEELTALNAIAGILSNPLELIPALEQVCTQIATITGMETAGIYLVDERREFLNLVAQRGGNSELLAQMQRLGLDDPVTLALFNGETLAFDDASLYTGQGLAGPRAGGYHAIIGVPILQRDQSVGVIGVGSRLKTKYESSDIDLLWNIGRQIGKALDNHNLYKEMQKRMNELEGLAQLSAACASSLDPSELANISMDWTMKLMQVDFANLRLLEGNSYRLVASRSHAQLVFRELVPVEEFTRLHADMRTPTVVNDVETEPVTPAFRARADIIGLRSNCVMPLPARGHFIGFISIGYAQPHHWRPHEIELVQTIANQVAGAIDNAQLFQGVVSERRKVQAIFDSGLSGLYATDAEGRIVMFNRAAERMTGWGTDEVCDRYWRNIFHDSAEKPSDKPTIDFALAQKESRYLHEDRWLRTRDGRVIPVAEAVAPLLDEQGKVTGAVGAFFDLSREQAAEIEREEFLKEVAHQLRSPLTAVLSALQLLERPNLSEARRAEMWNILRGDGERLKRFADQFLDLEAVTKSQRPLQMSPLPIVSTTRALVRKFRADQHKHQFHVRASKRNLIALADLDRVENILRNLLDNAVSFAPTGTRITITIKSRQDDFIQVSVQDRGPGIAYQDHEKIFEPFYRSAHTPGRRMYGHGLGLAIVKRSVVEMGGAIWLDSKPNHGATFHFTLRRYR